MVQNFPLDFLGWVRNFPHAEFSPAEKSLYETPPPPLGASRVRNAIPAEQQNGWCSLGSYQCGTLALPLTPKRNKDTRQGHNRKHRLEPTNMTGIARGPGM